MYFLLRMYIHVGPQFKLGIFQKLIKSDQIFFWWLLNTYNDLFITLLGMWIIVLIFLNGEIKIKFFQSTKIHLFDIAIQNTKFLTNHKHLGKNKIISRN